MFERIKNLCVENGVSIAKLERELGFPRSSIRKWNSSSPSIDKVQKVVQYFGVSIDYLYGNTDNPKEMLGLSDEEREFLDTYVNAKKSDKETVRDMLEIIDKMLGEDDND